jgi:hypothetical protein
MKIQRVVMILVLVSVLLALVLFGSISNLLENRSMDIDLDLWSNFTDMSWLATDRLDFSHQPEMLGNFSDIAAGDRLSINLHKF